jgi:hypothetical protein
MIAVSTSWNASRHAGWAPAVAELVALGHRVVALDAAALHPDAAAARRGLAAVRGSVVALFAPAPGGADGDDGPLGLCDPDRSRRRVAMQAAASAARVAADAGTGLVVLRAGAIPDLEADGERRWTDRLARGEDDERIRADAAEVLRAAASARHRYLDALCRALFELARAAPDVTWLLETPSSLLGLPLPSEVEAVVDELPGRRVGYWHDAALAARLGALGVAPASSWLESLGSLTGGLTLCDWTPGEARLPVGSGRVDWAGLLAQATAAMPRVLRLASTFPAPLLDDALREAHARGF